MKKLVEKVLLVSTCAALLIACVPARQYDELKAKQTKCEEELMRLRASGRENEEANNELTSQKEQLEKDVKQLQSDTASIGKLLRTCERNFARLETTYEALIAKDQQLIDGASAESKKLLEEYNIAQEALQHKEDALKILEKALKEKESHLERMTAELAKRERRVLELEGIINRKDSLVNALKKTVQEALLGFEGNGLTIEQRNGKVYVSLDESLLFASGSSVVDAKGVTVLKKLSSVLEQETDINIVVEGHTDNVPYKGSGGINDNWDLSAKRATSVVKILINNSTIDPQRLTASGRGEYVPLDPSNTSAGRARNRRTEVILTPKLDELYKLLNSDY